MTNPINNLKDIIDSRDVIARIEELKSLLDGCMEKEDIYELVALCALRNEAEGYAPDWEYGETLIRDSYFKTYAQELAKDIGAINSDAGWPNTCIDWEQAARELRMDYTAVDFDGVTYWIR